MRLLTLYRGVVSLTKVRKIFLCPFRIIINTFPIENHLTIENQSIESDKIINNH